MIEIQNIVQGNFRCKLHMILLEVVLFILTADGVLADGNGTTIRHNRNNTHHTK
jgi:hypothetical protein